MNTLYKYLPSKYVEAFVSRGEVLFRSLSYFRHYEELEVRGDRHEGSRLFHPSVGLEITKVESGEKLRLPWAFEARVQDRDIFVFCLSTKLSAELAKKFKADVCVEIQNPARFLAGIRAAVLRRASIKNNHLAHGAVTYYSPESPPYASWAVPDQVVLSKVHGYAWQSEYRIAFALNGAFSVNNVSTQITATPGEPNPSLLGHPERVLKIGSLKPICKVHTLA